MIPPICVLQLLLLLSLVQLKPSSSVKLAPSSPALQLAKSARSSFLDQLYWPDWAPSAELEPGPDRRFDYEDERERKNHHRHHHHHHKVLKVEEHQEAKELSKVYPVLLALLIIGALFVPFISLFFFLAVSAFNCNGIGAGFSPVTPIFGRKRRRRRRSITHDELLSPHPANATDNHLADQETELDTITTHGLPLIVLFDALEGIGHLSSQQPADYQFWRKELARSTIRLAAALDSWTGH